MVNFFDDIFKKLIIKALLDTGLLELVNCNVSTSILIKILKGSNKMFLTLKLVEMNGCCYKFPIINGPIIVNISLYKSYLSQYYTC